MGIVTRVRGNGWHVSGVGVIHIRDGLPVRAIRQLAFGWIGDRRLRVPDEIDRTLVTGARSGDPHDVKESSGVDRNRWLCRIARQDERTVSGSPRREDNLSAPRG